MPAKTKNVPEEPVELDEELIEPEEPEEPKQVRYKILKHFGVIGKSYRNREIELNWVSWNDGYAKYDIRAWDHVHSHMSKGITLKAEEAMKLRDLLNEVDFSRYGYRKPSEDEAFLEEKTVDIPDENQ